MTNNSKGDALLRLASALASYNQYKENGDLMEWLEIATVDDLRLAFPVLLNWIRNSSMKATKSKPDTDKKTGESFLTPVTSAEDVAQKIVKALDDAVKADATADKKKSDSIASLRMALAGYLHTNHARMRKVPIVADLEKRKKAGLTTDPAATNTLHMVNAASPTSQLISEYKSPEEEEASGGWGIPRIHLDLGLGLQQTSPADVCKSFIKENKPLLHPFTGEKVGRMEIRKVIPSKRKPVWIAYYSADNEPLKPDVLAKQGDDLRNDASLTSVSKLCESIWAEAPIEWTLGAPPTVCAYDVLVTAPDAGYLEFVPGKNFLELSQKVAKPPTHDRKESSASIGSILSNISGLPSAKTLEFDKTKWEGVNIHKLAPSLVGSYIVNFILGVRDRHEDNMMVVGDLEENPRMMQIDFGYVLMEFPGGVHFDMPRLTMPIGLVDRFNSEVGRGGEAGPTTLMEDLQHDMLAAYLVLRRHSSQVIPFCAHLMSSSYEYNYVESVLKGSHVFRTYQSEDQVIEWMSKKLTTQWAHFYFRREVKQGMVGAYYKFVETFENNNIKNDNDGTNHSSLRGKIKNFFTQSQGRVSNFTTRATKGLSGGSFVSSHREEKDNLSLNSVPDLVATTNNSGASRNSAVFKKGRSQKEYVFDLSIVDDDHGHIENTQKLPDAKIDMSQLNARVANAMKLQREVSHRMITQNKEHGTLQLKDFGGESTKSLNSV